MIWGFLFICLFMVSMRTRFSLFSPVVLFLLFFILAISLSIPYHYLMPKEWKFAIARLDYISDKKFWKTINVFGHMLVYFCVGVIFYKYIFSVRKNTPISLDLKIKLPNFNTNFLLGASAFIILLDIVLVSVTYGKGIFFRPTYHPEFGTLVTMVMEYALLFLIFFGGVLYKEQKFISLIIMLFVVTLCIGFGSRMATIYLMIYLFTIFVLYVKKQQRKYFILFLFPGILIFFGYNISLRFNGDEGHGLIPYLLLPFKDPMAIIENTFFNIYYTLIFGVYATCRTLLKYPDGYKYLITSLNPAPGSMTDWYVQYKRLRINHYAPYAGIGEIFSFPYIAAVFYVFIGLFFAHSERTIHKLLTNRDFVGGFILFLLTAAFIPYSFEYNLRSAVRFVYYAMIFMIILRFFPRIKLKN